MVASVVDLSGIDIEHLPVGKAPNRVVFVHDQANTVARDCKSVETAFFVRQRARSHPNIGLSLYHLIDAGAGSNRFNLDLYARTCCREALGGLLYHRGHGARA